MAYLYRHIRIDKNEVFYIGIGVGYRAWQKAHRNMFWQRIVKKTEYEVEIVIDDLNWEEAIIKEKEFIKLYGRKNKGEGTLVNLTDGGEGMLGYIASEETKKKISDKKKGVNPRPLGWKMTEEGKRKMSIANKGHKRCVGRVLSKESKNKISLSLKGHLPTNNKPILMYTIKGALIGEYESANEAARCNGLNVASNITAVCRGRDTSYMGFIWKYKSECIDDNGDPIDRIPINFTYKKARTFKFPSKFDEWYFYRSIPNIIML